MRAWIPVRPIDRHDITRRLAEAQLPTLGQQSLLAGCNVHAHHDPFTALEHIVKDDATAAGSPLLTGRAVSVLARNVAGQYGFLAGGALADTNFSVMTVGRG